MSPPTLLTLPSEIRQRTLRYTVTDYELREDIIPRSIGKKIVPWFAYYITQSWARKLACIHSQVAEDMKWVEQQWVERGDEVAREVKKKKLGKGCKTLCGPRTGSALLARQVMGMAKVDKEIGDNVEHPSG